MAREVVNGPCGPFARTLGNENPVYNRSPISCLIRAFSKICYLTIFRCDIFFLSFVLAHYEVHSSDEILISTDWVHKRTSSL